MKAAAVPAKGARVEEGDGWAYCFAQHPHQRQRQQSQRQVGSISPANTQHTPPPRPVTRNLADSIAWRTPPSAPLLGMFSAATTSAASSYTPAAAITTASPNVAICTTATTGGYGYWWSRGAQSVAADITTVTCSGGTRTMVKTSTAAAADAGVPSYLPLYALGVSPWMVQTSEGLEQDKQAPACFGEQLAAMQVVGGHSGGNEAGAHTQVCNEQGVKEGGEAGGGAVQAGMGIRHGQTVEEPGAVSFHEAYRGSLPFGGSTVEVGTARHLPYSFSFIFSSSGTPYFQLIVSPTTLTLK